MVFAMTARHGKRLDLAIVLIQQVALWPVDARPSLVEKVQEILSDRVRLRRVPACRRQVKL